MLALAGLVEVELGAADHHVVAVTDEILDELLEIEQAGTSVHQGDVVDREAGLQGCQFEEGVEHHIGHSTHLELDNDAHTLAVALVVDICNPFYLLILHQFCDILYHLPLVHHIGNLGNHYHLPAGRLYLDLGLRTDDYAAASCLECVADAGQTLDDTSCREVRTFYIMHQFVNGNVIVVYIGTDSVGYFSEIMGRHVGGHTHGDARRTVEQQQRSL